MLVSIDTDGVLTCHREPANSATIHRLVGGPSESVQLRGAADPISAFVNHAGHDIGLPHNPVGGAVATFLGAPAYVYAGTIVFTGSTFDGDVIMGQPVRKISNLNSNQLVTVEQMHKLIRAALDVSTRIGWIEWLHNYIHHVNTATGPTAPFVGIGEHL